MAGQALDLEDCEFAGFQFLLQYFIVAWANRATVMNYMNEILQPKCAHFTNVPLGLILAHCHRPLKFDNQGLHSQPVLHAAAC